MFDAQFEAGVSLAAEISKQLITLSTGILALSITFLKDVVKSVRPRDIKLLGIAWMFYLLTIISALLHLGALTGALLPTKPEYNLELGSSRFFAIAQVTTFSIGIGLSVAYGLSAMRGVPSGGSTRPSRSEPVNAS